MSEDSSLNSTLVILMLFNSYKWIISYDRANLKTVGNFYALTCLIFAGPVKNVKSTWAAKASCC